MFKIGIIVPVYNIKDKLLKRCVDSLVSQSYSNIEIIVVDDGSNTSCANCCDELSRNDKRIVVVHQNNGGLSNARNTGVKMTTSDYFMFVDADDWLDNDICERLVNQLDELIDVIVFGGYRNYRNHEEVIPQPLFREKLYTSDEVEILRSATLEHDMFISTAPMKLYRTDFIKKRNIYHDDELKSGMEGIEFCYRLFDCAKKVKIIDEYGYHYYYNDESLSAIPSEKSNQLTLIGLQKIKDYANARNYAQDLDKLERRAVYVAMAIATRSIFNPQNKKDYKTKKRYLCTILNEDILKEALLNQKLEKFDTRKWPLALMLKFRQAGLIAIYSYFSYLKRS